MITVAFYLKGDVENTQNQSMDGTSTLMENQKLQMCKSLKDLKKCCHTREDKNSRKFHKSRQKRLQEEIFITGKRALPVEENQSLRPHKHAIVSQLDKCLKFKSIPGKNDCNLYKITPRNAIKFRHLFSCRTIQSLDTYQILFRRPWE